MDGEGATLVGSVPMSESNSAFCLVITAGNVAGVTSAAELSEDGRGTFEELTDAHAAFRCML